MIKEFGYRVIGDILIGIPGLTEEQSIEVFSDTIEWAHKIGVDICVCVPLNRKERTIQGLLYRNLKYDETLFDCGLVQGEHTGLPWIFTVLRAIEKVADNSKIRDKIYFAQLEEDNNTITNQVCYNFRHDCKCRQWGKKILNQFQAQRDSLIIKDAVESMQNDPCYDEYLQLLKKQEKAGTIKDTLTFLGKKIASSVYKADAQSYFNAFQNELDLFQYNGTI